MTKSVPSFLPKSVAGALLLSVIAGTFVPASAEAATSRSSSKSAAASIEISGWIPYWATAKGTTDASSHISQLTEINPFGYTVKGDGSLNDAMNVGQSAWQELFSKAESRDVLVIPTIMWSDTDAIYATLSNTSARTSHIRGIVSAVERGGFDGIDIDYEAKSAETRDSFSAFLAELSAALYKADKDLKLHCTIEARMPLEARYSGTPPANIEYANDLPKVNQYCDRVRVMTYDQQTADVQLNAKHRKELYAPVSDTVWVEKVVNYMDNDIDRKKMAIGIPTYGGEYQAMSKQDGSGFTYTKTSSFNPQYALDIAKQYGIEPVRNVSGELSLSYVEKGQTSQLPSQSVLSRLAPKGTASGNLAAAGALAYSKKENRQAPVTFLTWSDAEAIQDKVELATKLGVAGVAIFKFDGSEDPAMWRKISDAAKPVIGPSSSRVTNAATAPSTPAPTPVTPSVPSTSTSASFSKDLQVGDENADVTRMQNLLIKKGYMKVAANGYFGPATKAALTAWQKAQGLPATGYFGPQSRAAIIR